MTSTTRDLDTISAPRSVAQAELVSQATAIEQARAVAEVHAAIVVAQQNPRNVPAAVEAMRESTDQIALADRAFFAYPKGKTTVTGPSIHLARELARVWGNIQYGISELRRDDAAKVSEMLAFAWDVQTNTRSSATFIVPHAVDTKLGRKDLVDLRDVYENNANQGARRVREAIFSVMPTWLVEEAKDRCSATLRNGGGNKTLAQLVDDAVRAYESTGVSLEQLEKNVARDRGRWTAHDVAQLRIKYQSIQRGEIHRDDEFPPRRVTAEEITQTAGGAGGTSPPAPTGVAVLPPAVTPSEAGEDVTDRAPSSPGPVVELRADSAEPVRRGPEPKITPTLQANIMAAFGKLGVKGLDRVDYARALSGREHLSSMGELTAEQAARVLEVLRGAADVDALDQAVSS